MFFFSAFIAFITLILLLFAHFTLRRRRHYAITDIAALLRAPPLRHYADATDRALRRLRCCYITR